MSSENQLHDPKDAAKKMSVYAAKLRDLNSRLVAIGQELLKKKPDSLEAVKELLEKEFGPEILKCIYDEIPNTLAEQNSSDDTPCNQAQEEFDRK